MASSRPYEGVPDGAVRSALEETFLKARQAIESEGFTQGQAGAEGTIALARICSHERISECAQLYGKSDHDLHAFFGSLDKLVECGEQLWGIAQ
jgi:hypothetical protein